MLLLLVVLLKLMFIVSGVVLIRKWWMKLGLFREVRLLMFGVLVGLLNRVDGI